MYSRKFQSIRPDIAQLKGNSIYLLSKHSSSILTFFMSMQFAFKNPDSILLCNSLLEFTKKNSKRSSTEKDIKNGLWQRLFFDPNDHIFFLLFSDETTEALTTVSE